MKSFTVRESTMWHITITQDKLANDLAFQRFGLHDSAS
jgi:hypothetical protein